MRHDAQRPMHEGWQRRMRLGMREAVVTDTFDYSGLASHVRAIALPHHASDVLRTRIEAAFVPVEDHDERVRVLQEHAMDERDLRVAATARAEAAEARVKVLEKSLRHIRGYYPEGHRITELARAALGGEHDK